ncbi:C45 family autoproteolytic acyltransferase/hydolase [Haloarchaeobius amylolyticus]|uniref:C45 family autoproteolytic acyltransferase/hydolase n=1 Tax=Haloarchaeobius amylolyticus TaxID=1198296 RepID=UPI00226F64EB|nr:C45 family peptidase [Haloarchaeobius amylolyticus]
MEVVTLSGTPTEMGRQYGQMLEKAGFTPPSASPAQRQFVNNSLPIIEEAFPAVIDELRSIAEIGEWDFDSIAAIPIALGLDAGCSVVAFAGDVNGGSPLFGRNYDFSTEFADFATLYRTRPSEGLSHVGCSDHWTGRHDGINEVGLAVGHSFVPHRGLRPGLMFTLATRAVLETCKTVFEGVQFLEGVPHSRNTNFLLADRTGSIAVVEASPEEVTSWYPETVGVATNHFQSSCMARHQPEDDGHTESQSRLAAIHNRIDAVLPQFSLDELQEMLSDPDTGVCVCSDTGGLTDIETIWSWTVELDSFELFLSSGRPDTNPYVKVDW